jgi:hypothetical protein
MPVMELFVPPFTNTHWHDNGVPSSEKVSHNGYFEELNFFERVKKRDALTRIPFFCFRVITRTK